MSVSDTLCGDEHDGTCDSPGLLSQGASTGSVCHVFCLFCRPHVSGGRDTDRPPVLLWRVRGAHQVCWRASWRWWRDSWEKVGDLLSGLTPVKTRSQIFKCSLLRGCRKLLMRMLSLLKFRKVNFPRDCKMTHVSSIDIFLCEINVFLHYLNST